jgi:lysophospholipase L1-like esterase
MHPEQLPSIVFLGDSITEGVIGASFVDRIRTKLHGQARIVNAGVNGDTIINLRRRLARDVAPHRPKLVVIMTGLNDLGSVYALPLHRTYYLLAKASPINLTPQRFGHAYRAFLAELRTQAPHAAIMLCTPTTLSEQPDAPVQELIEAYSVVIQAVANQAQLPLIDVRAAFRAAIAADPRPGHPYDISIALRDMIAIRTGRTTYPALTAARGYRLLCDGAHLSEAGADLAAAAILPHIQTWLNQQEQILASA